MKFLATACVYLVSLVVIACIAFIVVIVLAGPHAGLLPTWLEVIVGGLGWLSILILPVLLARLVWRCFAKQVNEVAPP